MATTAVEFGVTAYVGTKLTGFAEETGEALGGESMGAPSGKVAQGSANVFTNSRPAARAAGVSFDPDDVRQHARDLTADVHWDADTLRYRRVLFPYPVSWLPDADERAQLTFEFGQAAERIAALLAA